mmetsp:Transcript_47379/g.111533  ORF Transcript_47379/g.111533 Transcript_47379/m.111533 type:complete len:261 (-) Transcript_47379:496-1278(-)
MTWSSWSSWSSSVVDSVSSLMSCVGAMVAHAAATNTSTRRRLLLSLLGFGVGLEEREGGTMAVEGNCMMGHGKRAIFSMPCSATASPELAYLMVNVQVQCLGDALCSSGAASDEERGQWSDLATSTIIESRHTPRSVFTATLCLRRRAVHVVTEVSGCRRSRVGMRSTSFDRCHRTCATHSSTCSRARTVACCRVWSMGWIPDTMRPTASIMASSWSVSAAPASAVVGLGGWTFLLSEGADRSRSSPGLKCSVWFSVYIR